MTTKVYVASPLGFSETGRHYNAAKIVPALESAGLEIIDPWKLTSSKTIETVVSMTRGLEKQKAWRRLNRTIGHNNANGLKRADIVFAILDGVDVDSGTAAEIGFAYALGKPILGYRNDFRLASDNEGAVVNLQVEFFIRNSGGDIITTLEEAAPAMRKLIRRL